MHTTPSLFPPLHLAAVVLALALTAGCDAAAPGDTARACVEPDPQHYVRSRNPRSQQHIAWPDVATGCLTWALDARDLASTLDPDTLQAAAAAAFEAWAVPDCSPLCFEQLDDASIPTRLAGEPRFLPGEPNLNAVLVETSPEAWQARFGNLALSATLVTSDDVTGDILDADILLNAGHYTFVSADDGQTCPDDTHADLRSVLTHEVGHLLGFGHTSNPDTTMFGSWSHGEAPACETLKRDLADGDLDGLCTVYGTCRPASAHGNDG